MIQVSPNLFRGPRPKTYADLKAENIKVNINLETEFYQKTHDDQFEKEKAGDFGIYEYKIPCSNLLPPAEWQVRKILRITATEQNVHIHCLHGMDRTGYVVAAYRMAIQGWSFKEAVAEMFELGFHKWPYLLWVPSLKKYEWRK